MHPNDTPYYGRLLTRSLSVKTAELDRGAVTLVFG